MTFIEFDDFCRMCTDWNREEINEEIIIDHFKKPEIDSMSDQCAEQYGKIASKEIEYEIREEVFL